MSLERKIKILYFVNAATIPRSPKSSLERYSALPMVVLLGSTLLHMNRTQFFFREICMQKDLILESILANNQHESVAVHQNQELKYFDYTCGMLKLRRFEKSIRLEFYNDDQN